MKILLAAIDLRVGNQDWHKWLLERSAQIAAAMKARVNPVYVIEKAAEKDSGDAYRGQLETLLKRLDKPLQGEALVLYGSPAETLVEQSAFYDLVSVGPGAPGMLEFLIKGTMASRVIRESRSPVYVPRMERFIRVHEPQVFVGVDVRKAREDDKAMWMIKEAAIWARAVNGTLDLVYGGNVTTREEAAELQALGDELLREAVGDDAVLGKSRTNVGDLIAFSKNYDLAVMGNRDAYKRGSIANSIVTRALCDAVILPTASVEL